MNEEKGIALRHNFNEIVTMGDVFFKSGLFKDLTSAAQAVIKIQAGSELGLPPFASVSGIHIIQGKPVLGSNVIATLIKNDPRYDFRVKESTDTVCKLTFYENGKPVGEASFTMEEAKRASLTGKDNWTKYPSDMLFSRAISRGARRYAPGIFGGSPVYTPDELGVEVDEDGYIEAQVTDVTTSPISPEHDSNPPVEQATAMSIETAMSVTSSDGTTYGSMSDKDLQGRLMGINKALAKNGLTPEQKEEYEYKRSAAVTILNERAKGKKAN